MKNNLNSIEVNNKEIVNLLQSGGKDKSKLFKESARIKKEYADNVVYLRGLIEFSNICEKNCYYCGIRSGNNKIKRYNLTDEEIINATQFAYDNNYGSIVLQSGELENKNNTKRITSLLKKIKEISNNKLGITLSVGEQKEDVYKEWFQAGAHRYLLRIETLNEKLYKKLHPNNKKHDFQRRLECLHTLQDIGYQTGTGVMIGLPFQTYEDLADDLIFMKNFDIDMVGMGPYIEHSDTPLLKYKDQLLPLQERFELTLKMIAIFRIMMKDINIAAATALQAIDPIGREKALKIGANVIMPNITPGQYRDDYKLYENKPCTKDNANDCTNCIEVRIGLSDNKLGYGEWGDSKHFLKRSLKST